MNPELIVHISSETLKAILLISMPMLLSGLIVGIIISIIQVMTQIQEMTLTFVPKIIVVFITMMICGPWMLRKLMDFTINIFSNIPNIIR